MLFAQQILMLSILAGLLELVWTQLSEPKFQGDHCSMVRAYSAGPSIYLSTHPRTQLSMMLPIQVCANQGETGMFCHFIEADTLLPFKSHCATEPGSSSSVEHRCVE